jgi:hypothetical protein
MACHVNVRLWVNTKAKCKWKQTKGATEPRKLWYTPRVRRSTKRSLFMLLGGSSLFGARLCKMGTEQFGEVFMRKGYDRHESDGPCH